MTRTWIAIIITLVVLMFASAFFQEPFSEGSTYSAKPTGTKAFFLLMERMGKKVRREVHPFAKLRATAHGATLFVIAPRGASIYEDLLSWIKKGNTVVFFLPRDDHTLLDSPQLEDAKMSLVADEKKKLRDLFLTPEEEVVDLQCADAYSPCAGVRRITAPHQSLAVSGSGVTIHAGDKEQAALVSLTVGAGTLWIVADATPITNQYLDKEDNLKLFYQLAFSGSTVYFDEFHHGARPLVSKESEASWRALLFTIVTATILALVIVLSHAIRFGPAREESVYRRAMSADSARARGQLYKKYGAHTALVSYKSAVHTRVARLLQISDNAKGTYVLEELNKRGLLSTELFSKFEAATKSVGAEESSLTEGELAAQVATIEMCLELISKKGTHHERAL